MIINTVHSGNIVIDGPLNPSGSYGLIIVIPHERDIRSASCEVYHSIIKQNPGGAILPMPCGNNLWIQPDLLSIGTYDVPCPCGDKSHWMVKYFIDPRRDPLIRN